MICSTGNKFRQRLLVAQSVLQGEDRGVRPDQRRQQFRELIVGGGLQRDQDQIARRQFPPASSRIWAGR